MNILIQILIGIILAIAIYTIVGFIPGTDETSVLVPISLALSLSGINAQVVLAFFMASIITLSITNAIPTALVGLPGGVMSSPMMEHSLYLKDRGLSAVVIKKMAVGSLIGVMVSLPLSILLSNIIAPYGEVLKRYYSILFVFGAIFLSLLSKNKIASLLSIIPLSFLFMSLRHLYWSLDIVPREKNVTISFFLAITIGPLLLNIFELFDKEKRKKMKVIEDKIITIPSQDDRNINPFKIITKKELRNSILASLISVFLFVLSPVGLTILLGEVFSRNTKDRKERSFMSITVMSSLIQSTYISGILIPLISIGIPLSPVSIGPGIALFDAAPRFTTDNNIHHILSFNEMLLPIILAVGIALLFSYYLTNRYASIISRFVLEKIPHEAILALFISFIFLLSYIDAGVINIFGVILIGLVSGILNRHGVNYGVQFMSLYAAPWIFNLFLG